MKHLLLISIGPVQEFILSARRSRDLWFGSWLLSSLSKTVASEIAKAEGLNNLIFPAPKEEKQLELDSDFDVANKIFAVVDRTPQEIKKLAEDTRKIVEDKIVEIGNQAFKNNIQGKIDDVKANAQLRDLIEFYWVALPYEDEMLYGSKRADLESLMAARKNTRDFNATDDWAGATPKSSLDGQRESVIPEPAYPSRTLDTKQRDRKLRQLRRKYGVRDGERLCGVGLLKRHGWRGEQSEERFFSTSHVAALTTINRLTEEDQANFKKYIDGLRALGLTDRELGRVPGKGHKVFKHYDGHLLFTERLPELLTLEKFDDEAEFELARDTARVELKSFIESVEKRVDGKIDPVFPYYALLHADGDFMGETIARINDRKKHRELSEALTKFAEIVQELVETYNGSLVYAGGDDVLAFLPVYTVLKCARELAEYFKVSLGNLSFIKDASGSAPSLSVGIAIAHHLEPLSDALEAVRNAEKEAKKHTNKNALAVTVIKRSGVDRTVKGSWEELDEKKEAAGLETFYGRLNRFIEMHRRDEIPDGAAYQLRDLHLRLDVPEEDEKYNILQEATRFEAVRILQRKEGERDSTRQMIENLVNNKNIKVNQLADELIVARIFAEALDLAEGNLKNETEKSM